MVIMNNSRVESMWILQVLNASYRHGCRIRNPLPFRPRVCHPVNWEHKMVLPVAPYRLPIISLPSFLYRMYSIPFHPPLVRYLFRLSPLSSSLAFTRVARTLTAHSESGSELMSKLDVATDSFMCTEVGVSPLMFTSLGLEGPQ